MDDEDDLSEEEREVREKARAFMKSVAEALADAHVEEEAGEVIELDADRVQFMAGYDDESMQAFVRVLFREDDTFMQLTPQQAIYFGQAMIECGYSSMTTEMVFDIARNYLADAMGNVRPFAVEDAGKLRNLLRAYHEQRQRRAEAGMMYEKNSVQVPKE